MLQRMAPLVIEAVPGFRRSYTSLSPAEHEPSLSMPTTAILPRRGQVKLTALSQEKTTPKLVRAKSRFDSANLEKIVII